MSKPKRYYVVMANNAGLLDQSDGVDTLHAAREQMIAMVSRVHYLDANDTFTVVDREPDKEPVYA
jgi:hypothetical protein